MLQDIQNYSPNCSPGYIAQQEAALIPERPRQIEDLGTELCSLAARLLRLHGQVDGRMRQDGSGRRERVGGRPGETVVGRQGGVRRGRAVGAGVLHAGGLHLGCGCRVGGVGGRWCLVALEVGLAVGGCDGGWVSTGGARPKLGVHLPRRCVVRHILLHWLQLGDCGFHLEIFSVDCLKLLICVDMDEDNLARLKLGGRLILGLVVRCHLLHLLIRLTLSP